MDYKLEELIDVALFQDLLDKLNVIQFCPGEIVDSDCNVLSVSGWQEICTVFHRQNSECHEECNKCHKQILEKVTETCADISYRCPNGLMICAFPIIIDNMHLGNFLSGGFFSEKPSREFFTGRAEKFGFDKDGYLAAVDKVPVWTYDERAVFFSFIKSFIDILTNQGYKHLKEIETNQALKKSNEFNSAIIQSTSDLIWELDEEGRYCFCSEKVEQILGYTPGEILGKSPFDLMPEGESERMRAVYKDISASKSPIKDLENWNLHKNGQKICLLTNGSPVFDASGKMTGYRGADKDITLRKIAEDALRASEEKFRILFEKASDGIFLMNFKMDLIIHNESFASMHGYSAGEMKNMNLSMLDTPETFLQAPERIKRILSGETLKFEATHFHKLGYIITQEVIAGLITVNNKKVVVAFHHDITEKKKAEQILGQQNISLSKLNLFSVELAMLSPEENLESLITRRVKDISGANAALFSIYNYSEKTLNISQIDADPDILQKIEQRIGSKILKKHFSISGEIFKFITEEFMVIQKSFPAISDTDIPLKLQEELQTIMMADRFIGIRYIIENRLYGTSLLVMGKDKPDPPAEILKSFVSLAAVSLRRKKAEEEISLFKAVFEMSDEAIAVSSTDGQIVYVNPAHEKLFGFSIEEARMKNLRDYYPPESIEIINSIVIPAMIVSRRWEGIIEALDSSGRKFPLWERTGVVPDKDGNLLYIFGFMHDISLQMRADEAFRRKMEELALVNEELEQYTYANQELKQFAYTASHQLQEPIRTVSNYTRIIEEDYSDILDENGLRHLQTIGDATKRMSVLINSLLEFSRLGRNKKLVCSDSKKLINNVIADLEYLIVTSGAVIEVSEMPVLNLYDVEIRQLMQNLLTNAIKFQKKNTTPLIRINSERLHDKWRFSVSDNGIGIVPEHFERIFDIFQRLHSDEEQYEGKGIGLAYCKKIVQWHHGQIWVESKPGEGSAFYFTIPDLKLEAGDG